MARATPALPQARLRRGLLALLPVLGLAACGDEAPTAADANGAPAPVVSVMPVERTEIREGFSFVGRVEAVDHVELRARVEGTLLERPFTEGEDVAAGAVLFVIDPAPFDAAVDLASANLERARAAATEAEQSLARTRELHGRGNVSDAALDEAVARAQETAADVLAREAELRNVQIDLDHATIEAPIAGRISRAALSVGNLVNPNSGALATVTSLDPIYVLFSISERDFVTWSQTMAAAGPEVTPPDLVLELGLANGTMYDQTGAIDFLDSTVDGNTGTIPVRGVFPNPDRILLPGQFVEVMVTGSQPVSALVVPQAAVQTDQTGQFVLTVDPQGRATVRPVTVGRQEGQDWVIEQGLEEGDQVIVQGLQRVRPGQAVSAVPLAGPDVEG